MSYYVIVYVGYEGIEHILQVTASTDAAADCVREIRAIAQGNAGLTDETRYALPYPQSEWNDPERVCVMHKEPGSQAFTCCCPLCGVSMNRLVLY